MSMCSLCYIVDLPMCMHTHVSVWGICVHIHAMLGCICLSKHVNNNDCLCVVVGIKGACVDINACTFCGRRLFVSMYVCMYYVDTITQ